MEVNKNTESAGNTENAVSFYPRYRKASYAQQFAVLQNAWMRIVWFKRLSGWGFAEIYNRDGKLMGVLDHLGELMVRDQEIPMRLEAETYRLEETEDSLDIVFDVTSMVVQKYLDDTSFAPWMHYPFTRPCLVGTVRVALDRTRPILHYSMRVHAEENMYVRYIRGPWLKAGEASFGAGKTDAILPGVDWVEGREWSSGNDWFRYPWSEKFAPHRNKVSIPCMAVSHDGCAIGLSWNPEQWATRWFNYAEHMPQPVFAVPNFVDRDDNCLMGLMVPAATGEKDENQIYAEPPLEMHLKQQVRLDADIFLTEGNALSAIVDYVTRHGLPEVPHSDPADLRRTLAKIAHHYNTNLWNPDKGFGIPQRDAYSFGVPSFLRRFVAEEADTYAETVRGLREKIAICDRKQAEQEAKRKTAQEARKQDGKPELSAGPGTALCRRMEQILAAQQADGTFRFEPDGRHKSKDDFGVARVFCEPMGHNMDTALDMNTLPASELLDLARRMRACAEPETEGVARCEEGAARCEAAAKRALDACLSMTRPEGGDFWETPLHAANLLAAGHAAVAYYQAFRTFGVEAYREKAVYWIRALLPFTHLWEPAGKPMLYNTKPCFCSSDWYFANWVRDHVQWEVLAVFEQSSGAGIDWAQVDPAVDWTRYRLGITMAAARWMLDHTEEKWMPHNIPDTYEAYRRGDFDGCFPDTHNSVSGNYGGMCIMPTPIASNLYALIDTLQA